MDMRHMPKRILYSELADKRPVGSVEEAGLMQ
jgi:hypothetical protein